MPDQPAPLPQEGRDAELRGIVYELAGLLISIVGTAYAGRAARPNSTDRRDLAEIEEAGQRARTLVARLAAILRSGPEQPRDPPTTIPPTFTDWEADQGRA